MPFSTIDHDYTQEELRILERAHRRACKFLGRDPLLHPLAERVALTIMIFFERGERDFGRLAGMAVKREVYLSGSHTNNDPPKLH
jgi:hypothetical protein